MAYRNHRSWIPAEATPWRTTATLFVVLTRTQAGPVSFLAARAGVKVCIFPAHADAAFAAERWTLERDGSEAAVVRLDEVAELLLVEGRGAAAFERAKAGG